MQSQGLAQLREELRKASASYKSALIEEQEARKALGEAQTWLNDVQRRFDEAVKAIRAEAPPGTEWMPRLRQQHPSKVEKTPQASEKQDKPRQVDPMAFDPENDSLLLKRTG